MDRGPGVQLLAEAPVRASGRLEARLPQGSRRAPAPYRGYIIGVATPAKRHGSSQAVELEYDRIAHRYEHRWAHYVQATVSKTLAHLDLQPTMRLLDIGCGTGVLLREAERACPGIAVVGIDVSRAMLTMARRGLPRTTPLLRADAEELPFSTARFHVVVSSSSFHFWQNPSRALDEIARILVPGGLLVLTDWCDNFLACRVWDRVLRVINPAHQQIYSRDQCHALLSEHGYRVRVLELYKVSWLWGMMTASAVPEQPKGG